MAQIELIVILYRLCCCWTSVIRDCVTFCDFTGSKLLRERMMTYVWPKTVTESWRCLQHSDFCWGFCTQKRRTNYEQSNWHSVRRMQLFQVLKTSPFSEGHRGVILIYFWYDPRRRDQNGCQKKRVRSCSGRCPSGAVAGGLSEVIFTWWRSSFGDNTDHLLKSVSKIDLVNIHVCFCTILEKVYCMAKRISSWVIVWGQSDF